jgi:hypothetical protein
MRRPPPGYRPRDRDLIWARVVRISKGFSGSFARSDDDVRTTVTTAMGRDLMHAGGTGRGRAAKVIFLAEGYAATPMRRIAEALGVTPITLHLHCRWPFMTEMPPHVGGRSARAFRPGDPAAMAAEIWPAARRNMCVEVRTFVQYVPRTGRLTP